MSKLKFLFFVVILLAVFASCGDNSTIDPPDDEEIVIDTTAYELAYGPLPSPMLPSDNKLTQQGVELGRMLFYETMLSRDNSQSCASCHRQQHGFSDTSRFSLGVEMLPGKRQAMGVFNMAWNNNEFFWDGRAHLLRDQAILPIQDALEMDETLDNVIAKLENTKMYRDQFSRAFGTDEVTVDRMALALEQFMLSIVSYNSKFDQWKAGNADLTESEERGRKLFITEYNPFFPQFSGADCAHCHGGANFENDLYMNNGLDTDADFTDIGREAVTMKPMDRAKFKVPTLRNIALTAPYMHDGRFQTLEEVIDHYNEGIHPSSTVDPAILNTMSTGLFLDDQDKMDLVNFLKTLTDEAFVNDERYKSPF
jgi:cytochrome c peroxidase